MKLSEYKQDLYEISGKASDVARTAAFAGIAVIWIFKNDIAGVPTIPQELIFPSLMLVSALAVDLFQYLAGTVIWSLFHRHHYAKIENVGDDPELDHSKWLDMPIDILFYVKMILVFVGYIGIAKYIWCVWYG